MQSWITHFTIGRFMVECSRNGESKMIRGKKTDAIRSLLDVNPNITPDEAIATLRKQGIPVHKQTFYAVRSVYLKKAGIAPAVPQIKKKRKKVKVKKNSPPISDPNVEIEILRRENRKFKDLVMRLLLD